MPAITLGLGICITSYPCLVPLPAAPPPHPCANAWHTTSIALSLPQAQLEAARKEILLLSQQQDVVPQPALKPLKPFPATGTSSPLASGVSPSRLLRAAGAPAAAQAPPDRSPARDQDQDTPQRAAGVGVGAGAAAPYLPSSPLGGGGAARVSGADTPKLAAARAAAGGRPRVAGGVSPPTSPSEDDDGVSSFGSGCGVGIGGCGASASGCGSSRGSGSGSASIETPRELEEAVPLAARSRSAASSASNAPAGAVAGLRDAAAGRLGAERWVGD